MGFEKHLKLLISQIKSKDINTIIKVVVIVFVIRECFSISSNFDYYSNTIKLWSDISLLSKYTFIYPYIFLLGLTFLWFHHKIGWILTSGILLFYLLDAFNYGLSSINLIVEGPNENTYLYEKYGNIPFFLTELFMISIYITVLIFLWSKSVKKIFKIKQNNFILVSLIFSFSLFMYYFGYHINFLN